MVPPDELIDFCISDLLLPRLLSGQIEVEAA